MTPIREGDESQHGDLVLIGVNAADTGDGTYARCWELRCSCALPGHRWLLPVCVHGDHSPEWSGLQALRGLADPGRVYE